MPDVIVVGSGRRAFPRGSKRCTEGLRYLITEQGALADDLEYPRKKLLFAEPLRAGVRRPPW